MMRRLWMRIALFLLTTMTLGILGAAMGSGSGIPKGQVILDPNLPVHPMLQYGAQMQPEKKVTIIVQKQGPEVASEQIARAAGASVKEEFPFINGLVLDVPQRVVLALGKQKGVRYISPDAKVRHTAIDVSQLKTTYQAAIGAPSVWNGALGATGKGIAIAVLDSGVNPSHPDFATGVTALLGNGKATKVNDPNGHGTHVVGIIRGRSSSGAYIGVAPEAHVISLKIADDTGASREIDLIRGLQWVYSNRTTYNIRVVNLSVSGSVATSYLTSPISAAAEQLWFNGVMVITASGNRGPGTSTAWYPPSNDPFLLSVGALDHNQTGDSADDAIAAFSTRGYTQDGHYRPDVVAPGRKIVAPLSASNSTLGQLFPDRIIDTNYIRLSGTSMAAPVAAGVAALVLEKYPDLTPNQVKWLLMNSARTYPNMPDAAGVVDPARALELAALGNILSANQGLVRSSLVDSTTGLTQWAQSYWDQSYWDQSYWDQSYWDATAEGEASASYDLADTD